MAKLRADLFANANLKQVTLGVTRILNELQNHPPHIQMAALTATFTMLSEHWRVEPQDCFTWTKNMMKHADGTGYRTEFKGVKAYIEGELSK